jgi:hypothetical protein
MAEEREKELPVADTKEPVLEALPSGVDDAGAIPKGHIDPVYEAKARVLNHAVSVITLLPMWFATHHLRFKKLAWAGISGNCLLS